MSGETPVNFKKLQRRENWPAFLSDFLIERMREPFAWGAQDCCLFAADWVRLCLLADPAREFRGKYRTEKTGLKLLKEHGGVRGLVSKRFSRIPLNFAHRGDLVIWRNPELKGPAWARNTLGILDGRLALFPAPDGLHPVVRGELFKTAFAVGRRAR